MDNFNFNRDNSDIFSIEVDDSSKTTFLEMARWTKFLAILGFIFIGLMLIGGTLIGMAISSLSSSYSSQFGALAGLGSLGIILLYVILAGIFFYPVYCLLKYSTCVKTAINTNNKQKFNEAITYLKSFFKYQGILAIIMLGIYGLFIIIIAIGAAGR